MSEAASGQVTRLLEAIGEGERGAINELLPLVYENLRRLARSKMAAEPPGHTLQATALVHEAYLRLVGDDPSTGHWANGRHFFAAASEAMRRILVERARRQRQLKRGGGRKRVPLDDVEVGFELDGDDLLALNEALKHLAERDAQMHEVVMLRYFGGLSVDHVAETMEISPRTVDRTWRCARIRLYEQIAGEGRA
ncbi:MAG: ECF-type sigma factor [Planctomycetota bacterium]